MGKEVLENTSDEIKSYVKVETDPQKTKHPYDTKKQSHKKQSNSNNSNKKKHSDNKQPDKGAKREEVKKETAKKEEIKKQESKKEEAKKEEIKKQESKKEEAKKEEIKKQESKKEEAKKEEIKKQEPKKEEVKKQEPKKEEVKKQEPKKEEVKKQEPKKEEEVPKKKSELENISLEKSTPISAEHVKDIVISAFKIVVPVAACAIVIAAIISYMGTRKNARNGVEVSGIEESENGSTLVLTDEPLEENAHEDVNELMNTFYQALAVGDTDTIRQLRDYNDDTEILQYEKKSEFIESYDNIVCYTKPGLDANSYFVYVSYDVKVNGIETEAPGLNAFFVYTDEDGKLVIDGDMEDDVTAAFKLVTNQDDVVDLYNRVDVSYNEAIASDEQLDSFMAELPMQIKTSVGEALAQLELQNSESQASTEEASESVSTAAQEEITENTVVDQQVKTTDTVNVRSSDSQTADKIGKAAVGTELKRTEIKANGWSKVIFEGKEAYIKSEYLEVLSSNEVADTTTDTTAAAATVTEAASGRVEALTNVNVRQAASETATKLGTAVAGNKYDLLGVEGDWYKISFNGNTGYVKAEYFQKQ